MGQVVRDSIVNTAITYSGIALGYLNKGLLFPLLLSTSEVGLANVIMLIVNFFGQLSSMGTGMMVLRFVPFVRNSREGKLALLQFTFLIATTGILVYSALLVIFQIPVLRLFQDDSSLVELYAWWVIPLGAFSTYFILFEHFLRAETKPILSAFLQDFVLRLVVLFSLLGYYAEWYAFTVFITVFFVAQMIPGFVLFMVVIKRDRRVLKLSLSTLRSKLKRLIIRYGFFVYFNSLGRNFIVMLDVVMVTAFMGLGAAGVYTTMVFLSNALFVPYVSLIRITSPHVPRLWKNKNLSEMKLMYAKVSIIGYLITYSLFAIVWFGIDFLLSFLPAEYASGKYVFLFLMLARLTDALGGLNGDILLTSRKYSIEFLFTVPLMGITFILNYLLIPVYGGAGAAFGTLIVYVSYNVLRLIANYLYFGLHPFNRELSILLALSIATFCLTFVISMFINHQLVQALVGAACWFVLFMVPVWKSKILPDEVSGFLQTVKKKFGV